jgi:hypothetical protein
MAKGARKGDLEPEIDRLFDLPPEEFTAARDELAKRLQGEDRADDARAIKAIKRPTVAAWVVNQVARRRSREVDELLEAGSALQRAQRKVLSGVKSVDFREASEHRRAAVTRLVRAAEEILRESGRGAANAAEAVRSTFEAASLDDEAGGLVRAGRLSKELPAPANFGAVEGLGLVAAPPEEPIPPKRPQGRRGVEEKDETVALRTQREEAAREAKELGEAAARSRRQAIKARNESDRAEATSERMSRQAEQARAKARDAAKKAQQAEVDATRAGEAAERATKRVELLDTRLARS